MNKGGKEMYIEISGYIIDIFKVSYVGKIFNAEGFYYFSIIIDGLQITFDYKTTEEANVEREKIVKELRR